MAAESARMSIPVHIDNSSAERVAFDLATLMLDAPLDRQDEILRMFTRCLLTIREPHRGLNEIKQAVGMPQKASF